MSQFLTPKYFKKASIFWHGIIFAGICKGCSVWKFWKSLFLESQIFGKQLGELRYLQYSLSVVWMDTSVMLELWMDLLCLKDTLRKL